MKLIKANYQILSNIDGIKMCKDIEQIGRTCYRSENRITEDSYKVLIPKLIANGHAAMFEFGGNITDIIHTCRDCSNKVPPTTFIKLSDIVGFIKISTKHLSYTLELLTVK